MRGQVSDPVGGLADLNEHRLRFIGNANDRIREDYLRSLRYFRFYAWFGDPDVGPDDNALAAISANLPGIDTVSKERVGSEARKLLSAPDPFSAISIMAQTGALSQILPGAESKTIGPLVHIETENGIEPNWVRRLAAIGGN